MFGFSFIVGGGGSGVVVGVTDADPAEENVSHATVWGLSLTHGVLYHKKGVEKATLGTQTLSTPLADYGEKAVLTVDVEVNTKTNRIAFSLDGAPLMQDYELLSDHFIALSILL